MSERRGRKRTYTLISSSSEEEEEEESQEGSHSDSESESQSDSEAESEEEEEEEDDDDDDHDQDSVDDSSLSSTSCDDAEGYESESDDEDYDSSDNEDRENNHGDEDICHRVICLLQEECDLSEVLNLAECKAYLRKHGLRLSGTKAECIQRIEEHWRIKDGDGEALYARSSFTINCTGDVCKGDVVLFTQKVYKKFDKLTRKGSPLGKRTIAGRIVKESYGAAKQQHTFTVEVLWSKGIKKLPPLFPLLVKGRNLYKAKTFRQRWKNEAQRSKVLAEKHKRGAAARHIRAMNKEKAAKKTQRKTSRTNASAKHQKNFHHRPSQMKQTTERDKGKRVDRHKKAPVRNVMSNHLPQPVGQVNVKQTTKSRASASYRRPQNFTSPSITISPTFQSCFHPPQEFHHSQREFHHQRVPLGFTSSMMRWPHFRPSVDSYTMPTSERQNFSRYPGSMNTYRPFHPFPSRTEAYEKRKYGK